MIYTNTRNPILPLDIHVPDSEAHVMPDGNLYIYGSYDNKQNTYCSQEYHVVSTPDMESWCIHDISLEGKTIPWFQNPDAPKYAGLDWEHPTPFIKKILQEIPEEPTVLDYVKETETPEVVRGPFLEGAEESPFLYAPDAIHKDGKYYLYFCMSDESEGVAVAEKPEGPFVNPVQFPCGGIDPAIFVDTDGQAYYFWGQLSLNGVKLNADMTSFEEGTQVANLLTEEEHFFHEGASMRKIGDTYYLVFSDMERGKPTALGYATSKSPLGPFQYRGIIVDNADCDPCSWNNHGSIECFQGQWYVFYHRSSRCSRIHRRLCIEPICIQEDGTIGEVKMTSQGVGKPFCSGETIYAYQACGLSGTVFIDPDKMGSEWLTNFSAGDEVIFRYVEAQEYFHTIELDAVGTGCIDCYLNDHFAGSVEIDGDSINREMLSDVEKGVKELKLVVREAKRLSIRSVILR